MDVGLSWWPAASANFPASCLPCFPMFDEPFPDDISLPPIFSVKAGTKQPRASSTSNSATSRRNKLQRCSNCGGLGHKSRTCDQARTCDQDDRSQKAADDLDSRPSRSFAEHSQDLTVLAAYGLLSLQAQGVPPLQARLSPPQPQQQSSPTSIVLPVSPPCSPARLGMSPPDRPQHWQPLSPRLLAT